MTKRNTATWLGPKGDKYADRFAFTPEQLDKHWLAQYSEDGRRKPLEDLLKDVPRDITILEVGANVGNQLLLLKSMGFQNVRGVEINPRTAAKARARGLDVVAGDARKLDLPDRCVDMAFTCWCLSHLDPEDIGRGIRELVRIARKYVCVSEAFKPADQVGIPDYLWYRNWPVHIAAQRELKVLGRLDRSKGAGPVTSMILAEVRE